MRKLRNKFLLYVLLPVILIISVTGLISYMVSDRIVRQQLRHEGELSIRQAVDEVDAGLGTGIPMLRVLALKHTMQAFTPAELQSFLRGVGSGFPIECAFVAFMDGRFVSSLDAGQVPPNYDARFTPWFLDAVDSNEITVSHPYKSPFTSETVVTVAHKVLGKENEVTGVTGYSIPLSTLRQRIPKIKALEEYPEATFSIFGRDGTYLLHSKPEKVGTRLGQSKDDLHARMRRALAEEQEDWDTIGFCQGKRWYGGFQKSRYADVFVGLEIPLRLAVKPLYILAAAFLCLGLTSILALSIILLKMAGKIARPVNMLSEAAVRFSRGDYGQALPVISRDELGQLTEAFNAMSAGLKQRDFIRDTFGRYLTQEVVNQLLESENGLRLGGENREVSILISDLRGFTAQTAHMSPDKVLYLLNRYLGKMIEILMDHHGIVDEIEGDGILAFFGAPVPMEDHPVQAVASAVAMQAAMEQINAINSIDGLPHLEMGIGVNTGTVVVGNIGSERRTKYGIVGAAVNFAGRIESYTLGGQVLIGETTYEKVRNIVRVRDVIQVEMKGIGTLVRLYDIRGVTEPYNIGLRDIIEPPVRIKSPIPVRIRRIDEKVIGRAEGVGRITRLSETSSTVESEIELGPHDEIRIDVLDKEMERVSGEAFGKVISVTGSGDVFRSEIRFTFISPGIRRMFRRQFMNEVSPLEETS